jgi:hypothetical protein
MDFHDEFPKSCAVCTSLGASEVEPGWLHAVLCLVLMTKLGINQRSEIEVILNKMRKKGFRIEVIGSIPQSDIMSGTLDSNLGGDRCVPLIMLDPLGKTGMIRFCCYFPGISVRDETDGAKKSWWKFWG